MPDDDLSWGQFYARVILGVVAIGVVLAAVLVITGWCQHPQLHPQPRPSPAPTVTAPVHTPIPPQPIVTVPPTMAPCQGVGKG